MSLKVPYDVAYRIVSFEHERWMMPKPGEGRWGKAGKYYDHIRGKSVQSSELLKLKQISRSFCAAVDEVLFSSIQVSNLSPKSLLWSYQLLQFPTLCERVRNFAFLPDVACLDPSIKRQIRNCCGRVGPCRCTMSSRREQRRTKPDRILGLANENHEKVRAMCVDIFSNNDADHMLGACYLHKIPCITVLNQMVNLVSLDFSYTWDSSNREISVAFGKCLVTGLPKLESLRITQARSAHIGKLTSAIQHFLAAAGLSSKLPGIKKLDLTMWNEDIKRCSVCLDKIKRAYGNPLRSAEESRQSITLVEGYYRISVVNNRGEQVGDFLRLLPSLTHLNLQASLPKFITFPYFVPPVLGMLQEVSIKWIAMPEASMRTLISEVGDNYSAGAGAKKFTLGPIACLDESAPVRHSIYYRRRLLPDITVYQTRDYEAFWSRTKIPRDYEGY